ncbi:MAG: translocation/assembly module TamB domain-containing protein [Candidatus Acidiferrales bacterium]
MKLRWPHGVAAIVLLIGASAAAVFGLFEFGIAQRWVRDALVHQLQARTGARVELGGFHLHPLRLSAELDNLTLHGQETPAEAPLFHAERVQVGFTVLSWFGRRFKMDELIVERPEVSVQLEKNGRSNLPTPKIPASGTPWQQTLFNLRIGRVELRDGSASIHDQRVPLSLKGQNLEFLLKYAAPGGGDEAYVGNLSWNQVELDLKRDVPLRFDMSAKFELHPDSFELNELVWRSLHSELNLRAELPSFARADWNLHYRGRVSLEDLRKIFREPLTPDVIADFTGEARYAAGNWSGSGHFDGHDVKLPYDWFHATNMETSGNYSVAKDRLVVENLAIRALEGSLDGRLEMDLKTLAFRTQTHFHHASLAAAMDAVNNSDFPIDTLHWDGAMDVDSTNTWTANFRHFRSQGTARWSPPVAPTPGTIPVEARIVYDYSEDTQICTLTQSEINTPDTQIHMDGMIGGRDSALELQLKAGNLVEWDDFINRLRGVDAVPTRVAGSVTFRGRILGPIAGPTFSGHVHVADARYDSYQADEIDGDLDYSLDDFRLMKTVIKRGAATVHLDLAMQLDGSWGFAPGSTWSLEAETRGAPSQDVQAIFGGNYPVTATVTATLHGSGTDAAPVLDSHFALEDIETKGFRFDQLSGDVHTAHDEISLTHAILRRDAGRISGDILYRPQEKSTEFNLAGTGILLEKIRALQNWSLPVTGRLDFAVCGSGPVRAPVGEGEFHLANLQVGTDEQGNFHGKLESDGQNVHLALNSEGSNGQLGGELTVGLAGDQEISGRLTVAKFDLDPLFSAGLHLKNLTGHSVVDGNFTLDGALRKPDLIEVNAEISRISLNYLFISLQNDGPVRFTYHRNEIRIAQAHLHGPDSDFQISGAARFDRERPVHVNVTGGVNLGLLKGILPDIHAQGEANVNMAIEGTMSKPRITGRAMVRDASANYSDFPVGLSHLNGDLVFDRSRLLFENVTADSGGGQLVLNGSVTYGEEGPLRYEVNARTTQVRIRYPAGMSWLMGGTLRLAGTSDRAVLSGNLELKRLLFAPGADITSFFSASSDSSAGAPPSSPFMRNLTFDVAAHTSPGARIEWTGAQVEIDSDLHLRGTWDRPILLGHIHLLGGEMSFRGNTFTLTRGDVNFANPFQLDPELNIEATSTISQYQVTINFSGRASKLSLSYRSDPPLPDSDIIALLAVGSTGQESALRSSAGSNYGATALLSEAVSSGIGGRIEHLFGISHFRIDPFLAGTATESNASARVTIEQQITRDFTVTYSSNAASDQEQLIQVEYHLKRDVSIVFLRDINGTYGLDVKFVKHFH